MKPPTYYFLLQFLILLETSIIVAVLLLMEEGFGLPAIFLIWTILQSKPILFVRIRITHNRKWPIAGSRGSGRTPLDWDNRMRIAISAARGLAHLHVVGKVVHGNIKSSNILLRPDQDASFSDFGLNPLFGTSTPPSRVAGYRAPEVVETRKVTFKSDVYSFGVLLLELLTGKAPNQASLGEEGIDLPRWVQSVVREEWTAEVFDVELMRYHNIEEEMVQLLQIAMACVSTVPDQRPAMQEVVRMIEDINRGETDDGLRQSSDDPSKGSDGHTPPQEPRTPPGVVTP